MKKLKKSSTDVSQFKPLTTRAFLKRWVRECLAFNESRWSGSNGKHFYTTSHSILKSFCLKHKICPSDLYGFAVWFWRYKVFKLMGNGAYSTKEDVSMYGDIVKALRYFWEYRQWVMTHKDTVVRYGTEQAIEKVREMGDGG